jgi:hypothetical protein
MVVPALSLEFQGLQRRRAMKTIIENDYQIHDLIEGKQLCTGGSPL